MTASSSHKYPVRTATPHDVDRARQSSEGPKTGPGAPRRTVDELEVDQMWSKLAQICVVTGRAPETLTADEYLLGRELFWAAVTTKHRKAPKTLCTALFWLDAVMFHRGQAPKPSPRTPWAARSVPEIGWDRITATATVMAATMRRYLDQLAVSRRASSVTCIETTLRQFAGHLITTSQVVIVAGITRVGIEAYKTWLAGRGGYRKKISRTTIGMRMGHLGAFFRRIIEWDYPHAPDRPPVYASDVPIKDNRSPSSSTMLRTGSAWPRFGV